MKLDNMILTDFAAAIISPPNSNGEQTTRATVISVDENDDKLVTIRLDGSNEDTAATTTVKCEAEDRVMVLLKGHKATVIGNISSPVLKKVTANDIVAGAVTADAITVSNIESDDENSWINFHLGTFNFGEKLIWDGSDLTVRGTLTAGSGSKIGPWMISDDQIYKDVTVDGNEYRSILHAPNAITGSTKAFTVAVKPNGQNWTYPFAVTYDGSFTSTKGSIGGWDILPTKLTRTFTNSNNSSITIDLNPNYGLDIANNTANDLVRVAYDGIWGINWNAGKTVMEEYFQLTPNTFTMISNLASGSSQTSINGLGMLTNGDIIAGGYISEGGTALSGKYAPINLNYVRDSANNNSSITFSYASAGLNYADYTWLAAWNGYQLRAVHKSQFLASTGGTLTGGLTVSAGAVNVQAGNVRAAGASDVYAYAENTTTKCYAAMRSHSNGLHGLYSNGYWNQSAFVSSASWFCYRGYEGNWYIADKTTVNGSLSVKGALKGYNEGYTTMRPVVGTNAGSAAVGVVVSSASNFGIYARWGAGATAAMSGRTISCPGSDIRLKENVEDSTIDALSVINAIKIRQFDWKDKSRGHWDCGMVVDEMEKDVDPKFCIGGGEDEDGNISYKCVDTFYLQGYEVKAIQELSARIEELERRLNEQRN